MDVGGDSGKGSEGSKEHCRVSYHFRKQIYHHEQNTSKNINIKGSFGEVSERNEKDIGNWKTGDIYYKVLEKLAKQCSAIGQKVEHMSGEFPYLAEEISKQTIEDGVWFLPTAHGKM